MATSNDELRDLLIARSLDLQGFGTGMTRRLVALLDQAEEDMIERLRREGERLGIGSGAQILATRKRVAKLEGMIKDLQALRGAAFSKAYLQLRDELRGLSTAEGKFALDALEEAISLVEVKLALPAPGTLRALVTTQPFRGAFLREWMAKLQRDDAKRVRDAIRLGVIEGEGLDAIVARIRGTRALGYSDGIMQVSRREAEGIARSALNFISNRAREEVFLSNSDVVGGVMWVSVLDGRTTTICASRDGHVAPLGADPSLPPDAPRLQPPNVRPPAHFKCRSLMVAVINGIGVLGDRPFVTSTKTPEARRVDFVAAAREKAGGRWSGMTRSARTRAVAAEREAWAAKNIGLVPGKTTYEEFIARQSAQFQDDWLGPSRGALFRRGGLELQDFVSSSGREWTLPELAEREPAAFLKAGLI